MRKLIFISVFASLFIGTQVYCQSDIIEIRNPSFEDFQRRGGALPLPIRGWLDCGLINFPRESPPDIHPANFWGVNKKASLGDTYLGMVVRENNSWESVGQRLASPLVGDNCYLLSVDLALSETYLSPTPTSRGQIVNIAHPVILRIWGGHELCSTDELLAESFPISNVEWNRFDLNLNPSETFDHIIFEAFYTHEALYPYNGHVLVDNLSEIIWTPCNTKK